jgi:hypothetical protein
MKRYKHTHPVGPIIAAVIGAAVVGATLLSSATNVAWAQTEPPTAANGVLLPPPDFDPAAARNEELAGSAVVPATSTAPVSAGAESVLSGTPEAVAGAPEAGNSTTTVLGGADVAVSSVGGSYEVDGPNRRSDRGR